MQQFLVRAHEEREEAVELVEAALHGASSRSSPSRMRHSKKRQAASVSLSVYEADAERLELAAHQVRIGQRAVVHQAEVLPGRERMRMRRRDGGFGGHARVRRRHACR